MCDGSDIGLSALTRRGQSSAQVKAHEHSWEAIENRVSVRRFAESGVFKECSRADIGHGEIDLLALVVHGIAFHGGCSVRAGEFDGARQQVHANVAQALMETSRMRIGPGGFLMPYHHPGELANRVAMLPEIFAWVGEYVEQNYRPEPKKRIKPRSFKHPKDRV